MFMSRRQVGCFLLILLSISAFHHGVLGARYLKEKVEDMKKSQNWKEGSNADQDSGFVARVNREIPSCPDPLHNK